MKKLFILFSFVALVISSVILVACVKNNDQEPTPTVYYSVSFESNGGNSISSQTIEEGHYVARPANPTYAGYDFVYWATDVELNNEYDFSSKVYSDLVLYAKWEVAGPYTIYWKNYDGTNLEVDYDVEYGVTPTYDGVTPTRTSTAQYTYTFTGWSPEVEEATANTTYTAQYTENLRSYSIVFRDENGNVLQESTLDYGVTPSYSYAGPSDTQEWDYTFEGWSTTQGGGVITIPSVTGPASYYAVVSQVKQVYTITWLDADSSLLGTTNVEYGVTPSYNLPADTVEWDYTAWSPSVVSVIGTATYTAQRNKQVYVITWLDADSSLLGTTNVEYGVTPSYNLPADTAEWDYTAWSPSVVSVTGTATYTALRNKQVYTITWLDANSSLLGTTNVEYGATPSYNLPADTVEWDYTAWSPSVVSVTGAATYTALRNKQVYVITWKDTDLSLLGTTNVEYGTFPSYNLPADTAEWDYTAWSPELVSVVGPAEYVAHRSKQIYVITWLDADLSLLGTTNVEYGVTPSYTLPEDTEEWDYTAWSPSVVSVTGTATYTAQRNSKECAIVFNSNGGSVVETITVDYATSVNKPSNPTRSGYTFAGWYSESELSNLVNWPLEVTAPTITLYAKWTEHTLTLNFTNYTTLVGSEASVELTYTQLALYSLPTATKPGYTFIDWTNKSNVNQEYIASASKSLTLSANWEEHTLTITFVYEGTLNGSDDTVVRTYSQLSSYSLPTASRSGFGFTGWDNAASVNQEYIELESKSITLTATWNEYTLTLNFSNYYNLAEPTVVLTYTQLATYKLPTPTRPGYKFSHWSYELEVSQSYIATGSKTLSPSAYWNEYYLTITYANIDGIYSGVITQNPLPIPYSSLASYVLPQVSKDGYTFAGWDLADSVNQAYIESESKSLTLNATWTENTLTITYANYYSLVGSDTTVIVGYTQLSTYVLPSAIRDGYAFASWDNEASVVASYIKSGSKSLTLTATWTENTLTITYADYYNLAEPTVTLTYTQLASYVLPAPTRTGYTFVSWDNSSSVKQSYIASGSQSLTLTASWDENELTITFLGLSDINESVDERLVLTYTELGTYELPVVTKDDYKFVEWLNEEYLTQSYIASESKELTITATWVEAFVVTFVDNYEGVSDPEAQEVGLGAKVTEPSLDAYNTYLYGLDGWYSDANLTTKWNFSTNVVQSSITLYAKWGVLEDDLTAESNGSVTFKNDTANKSQYTDASGDILNQLFETSSNGDQKLVVDGTGEIESIMYDGTNSPNHRIFSSNGKELYLRVTDESSTLTLGSKLTFTMKAGVIVAGVSVTYTVNTGGMCLINTTENEPTASGVRKEINSNTFFIQAADNDTQTGTSFNTLLQITSITIYYQYEIKVITEYTHTPTITYTGSDSISNVNSDVTLSNVNVPFASLTWVSSLPSVISNNGVFTLPDYNKLVTLTPTLVINGITISTSPFELTAKSTLDQFLYTSTLTFITPADHIKSAPPTITAEGALSATNWAGDNTIDLLLSYSDLYLLRDYWYNLSSDKEADVFVLGSTSLIGNFTMNFDSNIQITSVSILTKKCTGASASNKLVVNGTNSANTGNDYETLVWNFTDPVSQLIIATLNGGRIIKSIQITYTIANN